jgi:hypothetical protein
MSRPRASESPFPLFSFMDIVTSVIGVVFLIAILMALDLLDRRRAPEAASGEPRAAVVETLPDEAELRRTLAEASSALERERLDLERIRALAAPDSFDPKRMDEINRELDALRKDALRLNAALKDAADQLEQRRHSEEERQRQVIRSKRIVSLPGDGVAKIIVLVEYEATGIKAAFLRPGERAKSWTGNYAKAFRDFRRWAEALEPKKEHYFLVYVAADHIVPSMELVEWIRNAGFYGVGYEPLPRGLSAVYDFDPET